MAKDIPFPLSMDWSTEEIVDVIHFYEAVDAVYTKGYDREKFLEAYRRFKQIVPSKSEEKQLFNEYEETTGQSSYHAVQAARKSDDKVIKL
ncbi:UPF0223 family protein [Paenalkalicoccus suaedae]|uniref:UPF0223 family protein n=1 Tax=Paenalkalicoccus suaedae TaxID=2592382 RepID=A0A859FFH3_9BACI|nr:UPF0223 family protein [Paenalkalicoccus suaedae]QKS71568.1 UPF0223 family protein [Paenalkalicoccus suaedae]